MNIILSKMIKGLKEKTEKNKVKWKILEKKKMMLQLKQGSITLSYNELLKGSELENTIELKIFNNANKMIYNQDYTIYEKGKDYYELLELYSIIVESLRMFDPSLQLILDEISDVSNNVENIEVVR
jgi:hypothetical protein